LHRQKALTKKAVLDAYKYNMRGVSANKSDVHSAIAHLDKGLYPNAFCKIMPDIVGNDSTYCNLMHADTAGTKTSLAYLYWRETGDLGVWKGIVQDAIAMNLDDMGCVGCLDNIVLSSTIGRNKHLITGEVIKTIIEATTEIIAELEAAGIRVHLAGGETADVGDIVRTIDVGFTAFARMKQNDLIINNIQNGDAIIGFASYGQATYETAYNGGMGSNGLSSARHDVLHHSYAEKYPESFDPDTPRSVVYMGSKQLTDPFDLGNGESTTIGKLLLSPTRTYLPLLRNILQKHRNKLHGLIHCTGGGQAKVLKFVENKRIVKHKLLPVPPLFRLIQAESATPWKEMFQVFNMGHRLEAYIAPELADDLVAMANELGIAAQNIGHVEDCKGNEVIIENEFGKFEYH
jgi:phosphoribosylformylglycinamidine cyclo-ligase